MKKQKRSKVARVQMGARRQGNYRRIAFEDATEQDKALATIVEPSKDRKCVDLLIHEGEQARYQKVLEQLEPLDTWKARTDPTPELYDMMKDIYETVRKRAGHVV